MKQSKIPMQKSLALEKIFFSQIKKIKVIRGSLHEDLQGDYDTELESILAL
jgi:hypothetical protein